jgi:hypothetical protein
LPLALGATAIALAVLAWQLIIPRLRRAFTDYRMHTPAADVRPVPAPIDDRGRELRAERRARELLRSCVNDEEWAMYNDLGFLRVWSSGEYMRSDGSYERSDTPVRGSGSAHAYLIYPHRPILAYRPDTGALLGEYCVQFLDQSRPYGSPELPASDDVLAKWMTLTAEEARVIADANMHLPGRQFDPGRVRRDLNRLARWETERLGHAARPSPSLGAPRPSTRCAA